MLATDMAKTIRDVIGFRRIFILFCTLVLLPALLMSSFVVVAIKNEREAQLRRKQVQAEEQLRAARATFANFVDATDGRAKAELFAASDTDASRVVQQLRTQGLPIGGFARFDAAGNVHAAEPPFVDAQRTLLFVGFSSLQDALNSGKRVHLPVATSAFLPPYNNVDHGVLSAQRLDDGGVGVYLLDEQTLKAELEKRIQLDDEHQFTLALTANDHSVSNALERILKTVTEEQARADAPDEKGVSTRGGEVRFRPQPPFDQFELQVRPPVDDDITGVVYLILALVCMTVLITGVVLTSRLIWQETQLSRLKTDFVSHVSHELRTPLTSIRMFIETLSLGRAASKEEEQECLDLLSRETERLSDMIERVLGYARLQSGKRTFSRRPVAVADVVDDAIDAFRAQSMGRRRGNESLELVCELDDDLPLVEIDPDSMVEALLNLLSNAYKYTGKDKRIRVFAQRHPAERDKAKPKWVRIGVEDNGQGLRKTEVAQVFDRFYQAGALLSDKPSGSGLGLAITRGIVEGNKGKIAVDSEVGRGSLFTIDLRVAKEGELHDGADADGHAPQAADAA